MLALANPPTLATTARATCDCSKQRSTGHCCAQHCVLSTLSSAGFADGPASASRAYEHCLSPLIRIRVPKRRYQELAKRLHKSAANRPTGTGVRAKLQEQADEANGPSDIADGEWWFTVMEMAKRRLEVHRQLEEGATMRERLAQELRETMQRRLEAEAKGEDEEARPLVDMCEYLQAELTFREATEEQLRASFSDEADLADAVRKQVTALSLPMARRLLQSAFFRMFDMEKSVLDGEGSEACASLQLIEKQAEVRSLAARLQSMERAHDTKLTQLTHEHETKTLFLLDHIQQLSFPEHAQPDGKLLPEKVSPSVPRTHAHTCTHARTHMHAHMHARTAYTGSHGR